MSKDESLLWTGERTYWLHTKAAHGLLCPVTEFQRLDPLVQKGWNYLAAKVNDSIKRAQGQKPPKYTATKSALGGYSVWDGHECIAFFADSCPHAEQFAREHAAKLNEEDAK